jgi:GAF domain-containing protein
MSDERAEQFSALAELAEAFTDMVDLLTEQRTVPLSAERILELAHHCVPQAQHTGLILREPDGPRTVAASSDLPERLDRIRDESGEGPALDVLDVNDVVVSGDVAVDPRWPHYGPRVADELGVRSVACYRLRLGPRHCAALTFLSDWPYAFDEPTAAIGCIFAAYCSLALLTEHVLGEAARPDMASEVHREIGIAVGIMLAGTQLTTEQAYRRLHEASQSLRVSLPEVARHVVAQRRLPSDGG